MLDFIRRLVKEEEGQGTVEYALIIALITLALIAGSVAMSDGLKNLWTKIGNTLKGVTPEVPSTT